MGEKSNILLVVSAAYQISPNERFLKNENIDLIHFDTAKLAISYISENSPDLILMDLQLPDMDGLDFLRWVKQNSFSSSVVVLMSYGSINIAMDVMRHGAEGILEKPISDCKLQLAIKDLLDRIRLKKLDNCQHQSEDRKQFRRFIGRSPPMQKLYRFIEAAAPSKATVFITGESGTGKELCAEAIHTHGPRADNPFVAVNCSAIPSGLMESELFGHVKGAYTGATSSRMGLASLADGGTLFFDEICEMDTDMQAKLLRFVQTGSFQKVGSVDLQKVDVRFICATNRDPFDEMINGRFREDLYYRLHVVPFYLPPLRERGEDILEITRYYLRLYSEEEGKNFTAIDEDVETALLKYGWPGNVRQLCNVIRNIVVLNNDSVVNLSHLPSEIKLPQPVGIGQPIDISSQKFSNDIDKNLQHVIPLAHVVRQAIENAIEYCDGNISKAAALLNVNPSTLYRKLQGWDMHSPD